ncbi:single-stranded-DNA-specific exonuclease RecJ [Schleiferilactobacillus shenzhenensis]|uniref:Single-stranded-DNA-specific exonuclease RecJ n=1 Tax=Schleiferilactobacillus shenzhenensis LY-73 TaxID=1231336 RepID=U4TTL8_9LACO|nr:single-stranded-DNA-specific exonuclease RecJ [Schleiferilactobacillus shenzhenensis]ERL66760.1 single-stranded-DNA-specific exonuclease [Schleiferilactobacillus shenzhenensis LY-73]
MSRFTWTAPTPLDDEDKQLAAAIGQPVTVAHLLRSRGITTAADAQHFLQPQLTDLHDPLALHDMAKAVARIQQAITANEKITVYGDYDADGITSTAIMYETLENLGADVHFYIPNRFTDGYGPNMAVYKYLVETGTQLIITVDNGVTGKDEVAYCNAHDVAVIITDHHELPPELPAAAAIVHARIPGSQYPFGDLSGAGIAFKVASALMDTVPVDLLDLAAIGTIADVMPLVDENRVIATYGLHQLQKTDRLGLQALYQAAQIQTDSIDEETVGFALAPRLNALGRVDDGTVGVTLLTTFDPDEAESLAKQVDETNTTRKTWVQEIANTALQQAAAADNTARRTLIITGEGWHEGVLGIVANRVAETTGKPTIVLSREKPTDEYKGSGRTAGAYNLFAALNPKRDVCTAFGGHAAAVGLTVAADKVPVLAQALEDGAEAQHFQPGAKPAKAADLALTVDDLTLSTYTALAVLAPFGTANPRPVIAVQPDVIQGVQTMGQTNDHLRCQLRGTKETVSTVGFNLAALGPQLGDANAVTLYGTLQQNTWNGRTTAQFQLLDAAAELPVLNDWRSTSLQRSQFSLDAAYVFFQKAYAKRLSGFLQNQPRIMFDDPQISQYTKLVLVDTPASLAQLQTLGQHVSPEQVWVIFYASQTRLADALPGKPVFGKVFNLFKAQPSVAPAQLPALAAQAGIDVAALRFIIQVFLDLGFLAMVDGKITFQPTAQARQLADAPHYQARAQHVHFTRALQTASWEKVRALLSQQFNQR